MRSEQALTLSKSWTAILRQEAYVKELRAIHKTLINKLTPYLGLRATLYKSIERLLTYHNEGNVQKVQKECENTLRIAKTFYA